LPNSPCYSCQLGSGFIHGWNAQKAILHDHAVDQETDLGEMFVDMIRETLIFAAACSTLNTGTLLEIRGHIGIQK
jgi:hypothetical protein